MSLDLKRRFVKRKKIVKDKKKNTHKIENCIFSNFCRISYGGSGSELCELPGCSTARSCLTEKQNVSKMFLRQKTRCLMAPLIRLQLGGDSLKLQSCPPKGRVSQELYSNRPPGCHLVSIRCTVSLDLPISLERNDRRMVGSGGLCSVSFILACSSAFPSSSSALSDFSLSPGVVIQTGPIDLLVSACSHTWGDSTYCPISGGLDFCSMPQLYSTNKPHLNENKQWWWTFHGKASVLHTNEY